MRVEIWSDIACPWCYVGKARFEKGLAAFAHRDGVEVVHRSFELDPNASREPIPVLDLITRKYGLGTEEALALEKRVESNAHSEGLGYLVASRDSANTFDIHRVLHLAKARGLQVELLDLVFQANFADERSVFRAETILALAVEAGLDEAEVRAVLADPELYAEDVRTDEREAAELGATGVPFFVLDRRYGVSGGQPAEVFTQALEQAWQGRTITQLVPAQGGETCDADGSCEVPGPETTIND